jgi:hypothetical protein
MKMMRKIVAVGASLAMAVGVMSMSVSAEASSWALYHSKGAPTSDYQTTQTIRILPEYTGSIGGNCSSFSLSSGAVKVSATLYIPNYETGLLGSYSLSVSNITKAGGCDIRDNRISSTTPCEITVAFTNTNAYGSVYGKYK